MKLNKDNKHILEIGDILDFGYDKEQYIITNLWYSPTHKNALSLTIQNIHTKQTIYGERSSNCYGATIIKKANK